MTNASVACSIQKALIGRSYDTEHGAFYMRCVVSVSISSTNLTKQGSILASLRLVEVVTPPSQSQRDGRPYGKVWLELAVCSAFVYECVLHRHSGQRREIMHQLAGQAVCGFASAHGLIRGNESR